MKCEHCGNEQNEGKFCAACGLMMTRIILAPGGGSRAAAPQPASKAICRYCANEQTGGLFCEKCGLRLDFYRHAAPEPAVKCPECGTITTRQLCPSCGTRIYRPEGA